MPLLGVIPAKAELLFISVTAVAPAPAVMLLTYLRGDDIEAVRECFLRTPA